MGFSRKDTEQIALMEQELQHFWRVNQTGWRLFRADPLDPAINELREEIELLAEMTTSPRLREACLRCLRIDDTIRQPLLRAQVSVA